MRTLSKIILIFLTISLMIESCDPIVGYEYRLNNLSDSTLLVIGSNITLDSVLEVRPNINTWIMGNEIYGTNPHDEGDDFLSLIDSFSICTSDMKPIQIDIYDRDNWIYTNEIDFLLLMKTGINIYTLEITNYDL